HRIQCGYIVRIRLLASLRDKAWLEPAAERRRPGNAATAANSIFFGVAKTLANGSVALADFTPAGLAQPDVLALTALTDYELTNDAAAVEVTLRSGEVLKATMGTEPLRLGFDDLAAKF